MSSGGFSIKVEMGRLYTISEILQSGTYLFADAIKKAFLIYLLKYSNSLKVNSIKVRIDDNEEHIECEKRRNPVLFSLINGNLVREVPISFSGEAVIHRLLNTPKSKYDSLISALFALLCSKSKAFESERFIFLWPAFNGIYNYYSDTVSEANNTQKYTSEDKKILRIQRFLGIGNETINDSDKKMKAENVGSILLDYCVQNINHESLMSTELDNRIKRQLYKQDGGRYNLSSYGYLLTQLSYYYRCKIIHANRPIVLFAYPDEKELHILRIINNILEEFIDETLPKWLDDEYYSRVVVSEALKKK